jgi:hypothetical protein
MNFEEIKNLYDAESYMIGIQSKRNIGLAHIAVTLAHIRREMYFLEVSKSWKGYIKQDRLKLGYRQSIHLANIGEIYLTFRVQLEENGIYLSENMTKMSLFDSEIASQDPMFYEQFKSLSCNKLKKYIKEYKSNRIIDYPAGKENGNMVVNGASLYIGDKKVKGVNLNEIRRDVAAGKRFIVVAVDDDNEARRVRRRLEG